MSRVDEIDTLDILIKLEFPTFPDWRLGNYLISEEQEASFPMRTEVIFQIRYDHSIMHFGLGAVSALFLPKLSYHYEERPRSKPDYYTDSSFNALVDDSKVNSNDSWVHQSRQAIERGNIKLCKSGVGGTYFVSDQGETLAIFKPTDEEPGGPNNPKKQMNFVPMLPWGNGAHREVAASQFEAFGVPETHFIEVNINGVIKRGSLQKFVPNEGDCSDFGANKFSVDTVHRLGILDICILNMDRNDENLLLQKGEKDDDWRLVPIDHTYSFPSKIDSYFNWQYWPQTKKPFSAESLSLISSINVLTNSEKLLKIGIDEESVRNVMASTLLLQKAAVKGHSLFQIAMMVSGEKNDLVNILSQVRRKEEEYYGGQLLATPAERYLLFNTIVTKVIDDHLENLV